MIGRWFTRDRHRCEPPMVFEPYNDHPDGEVSDRWQCGQCDAIWQIAEWRRLR